MPPSGASNRKEKTVMTDDLVQRRAEAAAANAASIRAQKTQGERDRARSGAMSLDDQIAQLQREYDEWESGVKDDMGDEEGEAALDAGAWVDGARTVVQFAGPEISAKAKSEFLRTHGLDPRGRLF
jgi:hypothetical protein